MNVRGMFLMHVRLAVIAMSLTSGELCVLDKLLKQIKVPLGSSLTLNCSVTCENGSSRMVWLFAINKSENITVFNCSHHSSEKRRWCNHTLTNLQSNDSGWYYCKFTVDIPTLWQNSTGTEVVVGINNEDTTKATQPPSIIDILQSQMFLIISATTVFILIVLIVILCVVKRRRRRKVMKCPIYSNTRPPKRKRSHKVATRAPATGPCDVKLGPPQPPATETRRKSRPKI